MIFVSDWPCVRSLDRQWYVKGRHTMNIDKKYLPTIFIILIGTSAGSLTETLMTSALPRIVGAFGVSVGIGQWLTTIYLLIIGVMVPATSFLIGKFSTRALFTACLIFFGAGSLAAYLSGSFELLIFARALQAAGTGILLPLLNVIVLQLTPLEKRGTAMGFVGFTVSCAPALGPTISGWMSDSFGWRSIFLLLSVLSAALLIASFFVKNVKSEKTVTTLDKASILLSSAGVGGLLLGFTGLSDNGFLNVNVILPIAVGAVCLFAFVRRQKRIENPLLDLRTFQDRNFTVGTIMISLYYFAFMGMGIVLPLYIQSYLGASAFMSGLVIMPGALVMAIVNPLAGAVLDKCGARVTLLFGSVCLLGGTILLMTTGLGTSMPLLATYYAIRCVGLAFLIMPATTWSVDALGPKQLADGVVLNNTVRQVAGAIGSALMVTVMSAALSGATEHAPAATGIYAAHMSFLFSAVLCMIALTLVLLFVRGTRRTKAVQ